MATIIICSVCYALEEEQRAVLGGIEGQSSELEQSTTFHRDPLCDVDDGEW